MDATSRQWAAHLLRRAGFGGTPDEIAAYAALGYEGAVDRLLNPGSVDDSAAEGALQSLAHSLDTQNKLVDGQALWLARMLLTQHPLQEKMVLFWHNHFATGAGKVKQHWNLMYQQGQLFRSAGLGTFNNLLAGVAKDPAMILWLDGETNVKAHPNENWGRELMELFTIGIGNYSEQDVKEVARAFTGWGINRQTFQFEFHRQQHDSGAKTIFGQTGNYDGGEVLGMLGPRIETGKLLARKLWRWFISDPPSDAGVARLAQTYLDSGTNISATLRALFLSDEFRDPANRYSTIKNPPEFIVGLYKTLGLATPAALRAANGPQTLRLLAGACSQMGMTLYNPSNVGGWPGGTTWMNPSTYFTRTNTAERVLQPPGVNIGALAQGATAGPSVVDALLAAFVPGATVPDAVRQDMINAVGSSRPPDLKLRELARLVVSSPSYQMN